MKRLGKSFAILSLGALAAAAIALLSLAAPAKEPTTGRKFAFLVGVEKYSHGKLHDLDFPENDVEELADVLNSQGFKTVLLTTRLGKNDASRLPTQQNVWDGLRTFLKENKPTKRDLMLVGLAGHGIQPLGSDESYFCPADANPTIKEGTKNAPANPETLISIGEVLKALDDSGVGYKLLVVDACRNDPSVRGRRGVDHVNVAALPEQTGVLLSCKAGEFSFEHKSLGKRGHGAFFFNVIEGLKGAAKDEDGDVTWDSLGSYVRKKVPSKVRELFGTEGGEQSPNLIGNINGVPAVLARITGTPVPTPTSPQPEQPALLNAPFDKDEAKAKRAAWAQYQQIDEERKNSIDMELVLIPAGRFSMGSPETADELTKVFPDAKKEWLTGERPVHHVTISQPFYLGKYEVMKGQFRKFVEDTNYRTDAEKDGKGGYGYTGDKDKPFEQRPSFTWRDWGVEQGDTSPVVNVSHNDAAAFCEWLSRKEGKKYRLPTEAEWEYACRAGTVDRYYNGDDPEGLTKVGNVCDASLKKQFKLPDKNGITLESDDGWAFTSPVGQFAANNFGLYDMLGNAMEWCSDWYDEGYYSKSPERDPTGPSSGSLRVLRGGSWDSRAVFCRAAYRGRYSPVLRDLYLGFRMARSSGE
jgi:formylglycine-generating enzyme required for sulfatase activity